MPLSIALEGSAPKKDVFLLKGSFDETSDLAVIVNQGLPAYTLDLAGLTAMNSHGVGRWIRHLTAEASKKLTLRKIRPFMISYANQVSGFLPKTVAIESFYVPYATEDGSSEELILFSKGSDFDDAEVRVPENIKSPTTGETLTLDVKSGSYFRFLGRTIKD